MVSLFPGIGATYLEHATTPLLQREFYKQKVKTLTEQLLEKSECQPIAQVEQLLVENRELRDKVTSSIFVRPGLFK